VDTLVAVVDTLAGAAGIPAGAADTRRRRADTLPAGEAGSHRRLARDSTGAALTLFNLFLKKNNAGRIIFLERHVPVTLFLLHCLISYLPFPDSDLGNAESRQTL
jgi:hypothetical protein